MRRRIEWLSISLSVFTVLFLSTEGLRADPLDNWHRRIPSLQMNSLFSVVYGGGLIVAVGGEGTIITSSNGREWTIQVSGTSEWLGGVAYGNGLFVVVGNRGTILSSADGVRWEKRISGISDPIYQVFYGAEIFVASAWGMTLTSDDGVTWNKTPGGGSLYGITYGNGVFVGVGDDSRIFTSPDGKTWTQRPSGTVGILYDVAYGNDVFVAVGEGGKNLRLVRDFARKRWPLRGSRS